MSVSKKNIFPYSVYSRVANIKFVTHLLALDIASLT